MVGKLVKKIEFAKMAGVSSTAVYKACETFLAPALNGSRIDLSHPAAAQYLAEKDRQSNPVAEGIDPLYQETLDWCREHNVWVANNVYLNVDGLSRKRAQLLMRQFKSAGLHKSRKKAPPPPAKQPAPAVVEKPTTKNALPYEELDRLPEEIRKLADWPLRKLIARFGTAPAFKDWLSASKTIEDIDEKRIKNAKAQGELVSRALIKRGILDPINAAHERMMTDGAKTIAVRSVAMAAAGEPENKIIEFCADQIASFIKPAKEQTKRTLANVDRD